MAVWVAPEAKPLLEAPSILQFGFFGPHACLTPKSESKSRSRPKSMAACQSVVSGLICPLRAAPSPTMNIGGVDFCICHVSVTCVYAHTL